MRSGGPQGNAPGFQFGDWRIEPASNSIHRDGLRRQLEPLAMDVLSFLCAHPLQVLSADSILEACWGSILLGDNPLHKTLAQLRRALDDSAAAPRYIETIRKRGYRTIAEVRHDPPLGQGVWLNGSPFRGLEAFQYAHAAIFFGRDRVAGRLLRTTQDQISQGCAMVLVLGPSGSGKSSLVQAGLLPRLTENQTPACVAGAVTLDCADVGSSGLYNALGSVLLDIEFDGRPMFEGDSADTLGQRLEHALPDVLGRLEFILGTARLFLFIDRIEAIFRLANLTQAMRDTFFLVLEQLACSGRVLVVLACRNDFYPHVMENPTLEALKLRGGHFDLGAPAAAEIAQIIRLPAAAADLRFEVDPHGGVRLDDVLCAAAMASAEVLPLLQYCLHELYRRRGEDGLLSFAVFHELGGIDGAIGARAEQVITMLGPGEIAALPRLLSRLVNVADGEVAVTSRHVPWAMLAPGHEMELAQALVDARLFVSDLVGGVAAFGIAHEALLRRWTRAAAWIDSHRQALQLLARVSAQAIRWHDGGRRADLLLPAGIQVRHAGSLLEITEFSLQANERDFILASLRKARRGERQRLLVVGLLVLLVLLASGLGLATHVEKQRADLHRGEAEGLMAYMLGEFIDKLRPLGRLDLLDSISARALGYLADTARPASGVTERIQRAKALQLIAEVKIARGDPAAAEQALSAARVLLGRDQRTQPEDRAVLENLGVSAFWLGQMHFDQNDWERAQAYFGEYLHYSDRVAALAPNDPEAWREQSYAHNSLGSLAQKRGALDVAAREFATSVALKRQVLARHPGDETVLADLADSLSWLAGVKEQLGELNAAMRLYESESALLGPLHRARPADGLWSYRYAFALWHQAELLQALGRNGGAIAALTQAAGLLNALTRQDPSNRDWQMDAANAQLKLIDLDPGAQPELLARLDLLAREFATLSALEPKKVSLRRLAASTRVSRAAVYLRRGQAQQADATLAPALDALVQLHSGAPTDPKLRDALVAALLLRGRIDQASSVGAGPACRRVVELLGPQIAGSADHHLLAPWVYAHHCLGAQVQARPQQQLLEKIGFHGLTVAPMMSSSLQKKGSKP